MMRPFFRLTVFAGLLCAQLTSISQTAPPARSVDQPGAAASRGELLYTTHCVTCHTTQMHWRAKKLAIDWSSLRAQVRRWQTTAGLNWTEQDITAVARYLNDTHYRYAAPADTVGRLLEPSDDYGTSTRQPVSLAATSWPAASNPETR